MSRHDPIRRLTPYAGSREDNAYWNYGYDSLGQVTSGKKFDVTDAALPGYDFGWTYDDIGNRKTATVNSQSATYQPNNLNQYTQAQCNGARPLGATVWLDLSILWRNWFCPST